MKHIYIFLLIFFLGEVVHSQQLELPAYYFNPLTYNPAYTGVEETLSINVGNRLKWKGIKGAPKTTSVGIHSPVGKQLAIGADLYYDKVGVSTITSASVNLSYYIKLTKQGSRLSFGLKAGFESFDFRLTELNSGYDPLKKNANGKLTPNFGAGLYYYNTKYFVGISVLSVLNHKNQGLEDTYLGGLHRKFLVTGAYTFDLSSSIQFRPTVLFVAEQTRDLVSKGDFALHIYDRLWVGAGYNTEKTVNGYALLSINAELSFGYNYRSEGESIGKYAGNTHEVMLSWSLNRKKDKE